MVYLFSKQYIIVLRHIIIKPHLSTVQYRILYGAIHYNIIFYTSIVDYSMGSFLNSLPDLVIPSRHDYLVAMIWMDFRSEGR